MLFNIIPIVAIVVSFVSILVLLFRKLPDASSYADTQEQQKKQGIAPLASKDSRPAVARLGSRLAVLARPLAPLAKKASTRVAPVVQGTVRFISQLPARAVKGLSSLAGSAQKKKSSSQPRVSPAVQRMTSFRALEVDDIPPVPAADASSGVVQPSSREKEKEIQKSRLALFSGIGAAKKEKEQKREVINVKSKSAAELIELGSRLREEKDFQVAEEVYIELIARDPKNARAYLGLGKLYFDQGNLKDAKSALDQAILWESGCADAYYYVGKIMYNQKVYRRALNPFTQALSYDQKDPEKWYDMGLLHRELNDEEQALASFLQASQLAPKGSAQEQRVMTELVKSYKKLGQEEQARKIDDKLKAAHAKQEKARIVGAKNLVSEAGTLDESVSANSSKSERKIDVTTM